MSLITYSIPNLHLVVKLTTDISDAYLLHVGFVFSMWKYLLIVLPTQFRGNSFCSSAMTGNSACAITTCRSY